MHRIAGESDAYVKDVLKVRTAAPTLTQYELVNVTENTPESYVRVLDKSASSYAPTCVDYSGLVLDEDYLSENGKKMYSYSASAGSGYNKSGCATSGIPDCGSGSAAFVIKPNGANSIRVTAYRSEYSEYIDVYNSSYYHDAYASGVVIKYKVSTPPSGGSSGYIIVDGVPQHTTKAIKPASVEEHNTNLTLGYKQLHVETPTVTQKTVLAQQLTTAVQNFAFDMDDYE